MGSEDLRTNIIDSFHTHKNTNGSFALQYRSVLSTFFASCFAENSDGEPITLHDVLIGEVWFCSGQSNMEMPLNGFEGCSNVGRADTYADRLATMVKHWRSLWKEGDIPFYMVEIAPYAYGQNTQAIDGALLREAQFKAAHTLIPNSGIISTNDLVESADGNKIIVRFDNADKGFSPWVDIKGFEIAGEDKVFHPAKADFGVKLNEIVVSSPKVKRPVAVRYCFRNFQVGNLKNHRNLPLIPFRTDQW